MHKLHALITTGLCAFLLCGCSAGGSKPDASIPGGDGEWRTYGLDYGNRRFSPLRDISPSNVSDLVPAYIFQTGVAGAFETNPLVADGVMYVTTAYDGLFAIDAKTGDLRWKVEPLNGDFLQCCGPVNRGVAISQDFVLLGRLDGTVVALDRTTGAPRWSSRVADNRQGYSITLAPLVYRDLVIVGVGGGDLGIRGSLIALSLRDGFACKGLHEMLPLRHRALIQLYLDSVLWLL